MDFRSLQVFVWVATLGSFRRAAEKLNTTQPAVSQRLAQLEADLGVTLIDRSARAIVPTERGRALLSRAEELLRLAGEARAAMAAPTAMRGALKLGASETIVHTWLPRFVERVSCVYPKLALFIEVETTPRLADQLRAHELDLAFLLGPVEGVQMRNLPLCRFPLAFLASPKLGLPAGPVPIPVLARHPLVTFSRRTQPYRHLLELFAGVHDLRVHASASLATVLRMAVDGIGIAVMPPAIAGEEIKAGRLRVLDVDTVLPDLGFTASWPVSPDGILAEAVAAIAVEVASHHPERWVDPSSSPRTGPS